MTRAEPLRLPRASADGCPSPPVTVSHRQSPPVTVNRHRRVSVANSIFLARGLSRGERIGSRWAGSTDIGSIFKSEDVNIKDVCELSTVGLSDTNLKIGDVLNSYDLCLEKILKYSGKDRKKLIVCLFSILECLKKDLKQAYYAGNIEYKDFQLVEDFTDQIHSKRDRLIDRIESFNPQSIKCQGARKTRSTSKHIVPLVITGTMSDKQRACEAILKQDKDINATNVDIPTPKLDDNINPKKLTVPGRNPSTYTVDSPEAADALTQYYKFVMKCLTLTTKHQIQVFRFNKKLYEWLESEVLPHLKDDKCYPAFGGVLRIVQTMRENNYVPKNETANIIFYRQKNLEDRAKELKHEKSAHQGKMFPPYVIYAIVWPLVFILFILICCQCFLCKSEDRDYPYSEASTADKFYYAIDGTPSISLDCESIFSDESERRLSEVSLERNNNQPQNYRQRGGNDKQSLGFVYQEECRLSSVPLKRQCSSKDTLTCPKSLGKRLKGAG